jgi:hypothetical protein
MLRSVDRARSFWIGIAVVLLYGGTALTESQNAAEIGQAEHALVQLDTQASAVALGETPVEQVDLGVGRVGRRRSDPRHSRPLGRTDPNPRESLVRSPQKS